MKLYVIKTVKEEKTYYNYYLDVTGECDYVPVQARYFKDKDYSNNVNNYLMFKHAINVEKLPTKAV